jgi:regulator of protease activity HflC (stomatin/prohibitin superfamily)
VATSRVKHGAVASQSSPSFGPGILVSLGIMASAGCATIPPGHLGVLLRPNGVDATPLTEGTHLVSPLARVDLYDQRLDEHSEDLLALSADGAVLEARASVLAFHPVPGEIVALAREVGPAFYPMVVLPIVRSTVRSVLAGVRVDQLDTPGIVSAQRKVTVIAAERLRPFHIIVDGVNLRTLGLSRLSAAYAAVVDTGVEEQKVALARKRVELARQQSEDRRQVARGVTAAQTILSPTLSPRVLADSANRAWANLLASPGTAVVIQTASQPQLTEIRP